MTVGQTFLLPFLAATPLAAGLVLSPAFHGASGSTSTCLTIAALRAGILTTMSADLLRASLSNLEVVDTAFSEAVVSFNDGSRLRCCHRVGERWARVEPEDATASVAATLLARIKLFRLNAKHLDI